MSKPIHVKPQFYTYAFLPLKEIALRYGYNLVIHGSMNRDMDLIYYTVGCGTWWCC